MARGWESKAVESQQADREQGRTATAELSRTEREARAGTRRLQLDRARVAAELASAQRPAHRAMLEQALRAIDEKLRS